MRRRACANPWGTPRVLALVTWLYIVWSLLPVLLAIRFAFNSGPLAHVAAGLVAALVLERPGPQRAATTRRCGRRCEHSLRARGARRC